MVSLRAVNAGDHVENPITTVADAVDRGTFIDTLVQMQKVIARRVDDPETNPTALAALSRQVIELTKEIETARVLRAAESGEAPKEVSKVDAGREAFDPHTA